MDRIKYFLRDQSIWKFLMVGGCCTIIDYVLYMLLVDDLGIFLSKGGSMGCSMVVNYFLNKYWSFSARENKTGREVIRYMIAQALNILANVCTNAVIFKCFKVKTVAFIGATGIAMVINYLLQRFWVFKVEKHS